VNPTTHRSCDDDAVKTISHWFCFAFGSNLGHSSVSTFEPVGSLQLQCRISSSFPSSTSYMEDSVGDRSLLVTDSNWHPFDSLSVTCHIVPGEETLAQTSDGSLCFNIGGDQPSTIIPTSGRRLCDECLRRSPDWCSQTLLTLILSCGDHEKQILLRLAADQLLHILMSSNNFMDGEADSRSEEYGGQFGNLEIH
jgi:hypothetical protein